MTAASRLGACRRALACVLVLLFAAMLAGAAQAQSAVGQAMKVRGDVVVTRSGADQPVAVGTALQLKDTIKTGAKARLQIQFVDGSTVTLAENTALSIDRFALNAGTARSVSLSALSGIVNALATKSGEAKFDYQIKTAQGYSAVRGTNWIIAVESALSTFVVVEGLVEVGTGSGSRTVVQAGNAVAISSSGLGTPEPIPPGLLDQLTDATDVASSNAAPEAPAAAPAPGDQAPDTTDTETETESPAPSNQTRQKSGGGSGGGGGGGGHGM